MTYAAEVLADTPRVHYRLGEASGATAVDASGNAFDGTYVGTPTYSTAGLLIGDANTAVTFATNGYVTVPSTGFDPGTSGSFSIEAWIKLSSLAAANRVYSRTTAAGGAGLWSPQIQTDGAISGSIRGASLTTATGLIVSGTVYHVVWVYDSSTDTKRIYRNGVQVASATGTTAPGVSATTVSAFASSSGPAALYTGDLDEVALYHSALSAARVLAHYNAGGFGTGAVLVAGGGVAAVVGTPSKGGIAAVSGGGVVTVAGSHTRVGSSNVDGGGVVAVAGVGHSIVSGTVAVVGGYR